LLDILLREFIQEECKKKILRPLWAQDVYFISGYLVEDLIGHFQPLLNLWGFVPHLAE
jgi:hypothetical protein